MEMIKLYCLRIYYGCMWIYLANATDSRVYRNTNLGQSLMRSIESPQKLINDHDLSAKETFLLNSNRASFDGEIVVRQNIDSNKGYSFECCLESKFLSFGEENIKAALSQMTPESGLLREELCNKDCNLAKNLSICMVLTVLFDNSERLLLLQGNNILQHAPMVDPWPTYSPTYAPTLVPAVKLQSTYAPTLVPAVKLQSTLAPTLMSTVIVYPTPSLTLMPTVIIQPTPPVVLATSNPIDFAPDPVIERTSPPINVSPVYYGPLVANYVSVFIDQIDFSDDYYMVFGNTLSDIIAETGIADLFVDMSGNNVDAASNRALLPLDPNEISNRKTQVVESMNVTVAYKVYGLGSAEDEQKVTDELIEVSSDGSLLSSFLIQLSNTGLDTASITSTQIVTERLFELDVAESDDGHISLGLILGSSVLFVAVLSFLLYFMARRRRGKQVSDNMDILPSSSEPKDRFDDPWNRQVADDFDPSTIVHQTQDSMSTFKDSTLDSDALEKGRTGLKIKSPWFLPIDLNKKNLPSEPLDSLVDIDFDGDPSVDDRAEKPGQTLVRSIPWIQTIYAHCDELIRIFKAHATFNTNCKELVRWCKAIKKTLKSIVREFDIDSDSEKAVDLELIATMKGDLVELVSLSRRHSSTNMIVDFSLSRKLAVLVEQVSRVFRQAISPLKLKVNLLSLGANLRIDEQTSVLLGAMGAYADVCHSFLDIDMLQVKLSVFGIFFHAAHLASKGNGTPTSHQSSAQVQCIYSPIAAEHANSFFSENRNVPDRLLHAKALALLQQSSCSSMSFGSSESMLGSNAKEGFLTASGDGMVIEAEDSQTIVNTLDKLQVVPSSLDKENCIAIGKGTFSKVFKIVWRKQDYAAKVISLRGMKLFQLQNVFISFSREVYVLACLKHPNVFKLEACTSTTEELVLVSKFMPYGSLNDILRSNDIWSEIAPYVRHRLLCDIAQGMQYLHLSNVYHRDLKSYNVLISEDFRAVLSDFGLNKTCSILSSCTQQRCSFAGRALAWTAPEMFKPRHDRATNFTSYSDVYSYGIVVWEVLVNDCGPPHSTYWMAQKINDLVSAVLKGKRPVLPPHFNGQSVLHSMDHMGIMRRCFSGDPSIRPTFKDIVKVQETLRISV